MNKSIKRTMGLVLALFVAVSMCVDISGVFADETNTNNQNTKVEEQEVNENEQPKTEEDKVVEETKESEGELEVSEETEVKDNAVAADNGKVYFEILPEIFVNQNTNPPTLFDKPEKTIGVLRNPILYGGSIPNSDVSEAWNNLAFNVYNEDGSLLETTKGIVGNNSRWGGAKYLGPYEKGHNYTISVDTSTLPKGYYSYLSKDLPHASYPADAMKINGYKVAEYDKSFTRDFASARINLDIVSLLYAKNEDVAKGKFDFDDKGQVIGWNSSFTNNKDYIIKSIDKDGNLLLPSLEEMETLADEGYKPNGFYFYRFNKKSGEDQRTRIVYEELKKLLPYFENGYGYLKWYQDKKIINKLSYFNQSSMFTLILDQSIPEVTFDRNFDNPNDPNTKIAALNVYYKKSLKNNCVGAKCLQKELPTAPTRDGKVFAGWNTKQDGTGVDFTEDTIVTDDITVYAQWEDPKPDEPTKPDEKYYTITVDPNGGNWDGDAAIKTYKYKKNEIFRLNAAPEREGYTFLYWKGSEYQPGQEYTVTENHKFTAEWKKDEVKPDPQNPSDVKTPNPGTEGETKSPSNNSTATNKAPQTGDSSGMVMYAGLAALMSMSVLLIIKKKRSYN